MPIEIGIDNGAKMIIIIIIIIIIIAIIKRILLNRYPDKNVGKT